MIRFNSWLQKAAERVQTKLIEPFLQMQRGTVIEAQVSRDQEGNPLLQWRGQQFTVDTRAAIPVGQPVRLVYEGTRDGQAVLRLLEPPVGEVSNESLPLSDSRTVASQDMAQLLRSWGLPAAAKSVQQVRSLFADKQDPPVAADLHRVALLMKSGIPVNRPVAEAWQSLWEAAVAGDTLSADGPELARPVEGILPGENNLGSLAGLLREFAGANLAERLVPLIELLQQAAAPQMAGAETSPDTARFLAAVHAAASGQDQDIQQTLRKDTAEAVLDTVVQRAMDRAGVTGVYAHVPLVLGETPYPLALAVFADKDQDSTTKDAAPFTVVLDVRTQNLGLVHAAIQKEAKRLRLYFGVDGETAESIVRQSLPELENELHQDGWLCEMTVRQRNGQTVTQRTIVRIRQQAPPSVDLRV